MGDLFHQTNANQSATNQQIGISTRDVGGSVITLGPGAASHGGSIQVQTLDPLALQVAGAAVTQAIQSNNQTNQNALQAYQQALNIAGEQSQAATQLASSGAGSGANVGDTSGFGKLNPSQIIWIVGGVVALVLVVGVMRK